jgi:hypothetical protein
MFFMAYPELVDEVDDDVPQSTTDVAAADVAATDGGATTLTDLVKSSKEKGSDKSLLQFLNKHNPYTYQGSVFGFKVNERSTAIPKSVREYRSVIRMLEDGAGKKESVGKSEEGGEGEENGSGGKLGKRKGGNSGGEGGQGKKR